MSSKQPSFIPPEAYAVYSQTFDGCKEANSNLVAGLKAREVLVKSGLPNSTLHKIWSLSDVQQNGALTKNEFAMALHLAKTAMSGAELPDVLPEAVKKEILELDGRVQEASATTGDAHSESRNIYGRTSSYSLRGSKGVNTEVNLLTDDFATRFPGIEDINPNLKSKPSGDSVFTLETKSRGGSFSNKWDLSERERRKYEQIFTGLDYQNKGEIDGVELRDIFLQTGLQPEDLSQIWELVDSKKKGKLNKEEFVLAFKIIEERKAGKEIPKTLPAELEFGVAAEEMRREVLYGKSKTDEKKEPISYGNQYPPAISSSNTNKETMSFKGAANAITSTSGYDTKVRTDVNPTKSYKASPAAETKDEQWYGREIKKEHTITHDLVAFAEQDLDRGDIELNGRSLSVAERLAVKEAQALVKLLLKYAELSRDLSTYSSKVDLLTQKLRSEAKKPKEVASTNELDRSSRATAMLFERMKELTGQTFEMGSLSEAPSPFENQGRATPLNSSVLKKHVSRIEAIKAEANELKKKIIETCKESKELFSDPNYLELENSQNWNMFELGSEKDNVKVSALVDQLSSVRKLNIKLLDLLPANRSVSPFISSPIHSRTSITATSAARAINSSSPRLSSIENPEERAQALKKLAEQRLLERQRALGVSLAPESATPTTSTIPTTSTEPIRPSQPLQHSQSSYLSQTSQLSQAAASSSAPIPDKNVPSDKFESIFGLDAPSASGFDSPFIQSTSPTSKRSDVFNLASSSSSPLNKAIATTDSAPLYRPSTGSPLSQPLSKNTADLFTKLYGARGSPNPESAYKFSGSLELPDQNEDSSSESEFDFSDSETAQPSK
ncbi:EH domain-containing and endocytosis protein 1 [Zancudomyces culisetae]|uniref:EH domain-containing and endocytosis protein 1 n=1 Tax=Zancudomyces culisetae TaxID=1213189 RepID=A0A1R1PZJ2_ZANCU|nr:EH domain-containing and endocytosis protein 1 [Zancudomyces culisetae]|eukprot:OMH86355.1 EH domain-containing and endocytosis protein 1 [Zancudomyces culisetae]